MPYQRTDAGVSTRGAEFCEKLMKPLAYTVGKATAIGVPESGILVVTPGTEQQAILPRGGDFGVGLRVLS